MIAQERFPTFPFTYGPQGMQYWNAASFRFAQAAVFRHGSNVQHSGDLAGDVRLQNSTCERE